MDTLTAGYQFSADAFRRFIIRTLTDDIPPDGDEKEIARFIRRQQFIYPGVITQKYAPAPQQIIYLLCCFLMPHPLLWHQRI